MHCQHCLHPALLEQEPILNETATTRGKEQTARWTAQGQLWGLMQGSV